MTLPLFGGLEILFCLGISIGLRNHIQDAPMFSAGWWVYMCVITTLTAANAALIFGGISDAVKTMGEPRSLRISQNGIALPWQPKTIPWRDVQNYFVEKDQLRKGGRFTTLYITISSQEFSIARLFFGKNVLLVTRKFNDTDDIESCIFLIDKYMPHG